MRSGLRFVEVHSAPEEESLASAVRNGLSKPRKELPSRFFYDTQGSRLFERITRLPEYYLTRCETEILERYSGEIVNAVSDDVQVIEFGAGSAEKTRLLLRAAVERQGELEYVPIDISAEFLRASSQELLDDVKGLWVTALAGDYEHALEHLPYHGTSRFFLFLGSTIGNFEVREAVGFLNMVRKAMRPGDHFLVGMDLKKSPAVIEAAYNDSQGITAQFNKNILARINRELCGHFDLQQFDHSATWIEERSRIEMRLVSRRRQVVEVEGVGRSFDFAKGESIHTENSHKWSREAFSEMCTAAKLTLQDTWTDAAGCFSLNLLTVSET